MENSNQKGKIVCPKVAGVKKKLFKLPEEKVYVNIHKYGNTSAASIPLALVEALEEGRAKVGDTLAFVSFGAGLTWASAIVKLVEREPPKPTLWQRVRGLIQGSR